MVAGLPREFKMFLLRGNVVDLAVAVVVGAAFSALVKAAVEDLITPLIGIAGNKDFSDFSFTVQGSTFRYGAFVNDLISFLMVAAVVFFLIVKPINVLVSRTRMQPPADPTTRKCPECLSEIPRGARRCRFCTALIGTS
ncbi:MAG: large conductance mechanosensitive channel protein MscL [Dehalococcoidia bacterium]|nr:large conductance mechanosensitive channel protein MscL [Dehalococcoidia bacterium]